MCIHRIRRACPTIIRCLCRLGSGVLLVVLALQPAWAKPAQTFDMARLQQMLGYRFLPEYRAQVEPVLEQYARSRGHKAIAVSSNPSIRQAAMGMAREGDSELTAALVALRQCERYRQSNVMYVAPCEVLMLNDTAVPAAQRHKARFGDADPAMVWQVHAPGPPSGAAQGETPPQVYVLGSIHALKAAFHPLAPVFHKVFAAADRLALEINPLLSAAPERAAQMTRMMSTDPDQNRRDMPRKLRAQIKRFARDQGAAVESLYRLAPAMLASQLSLMKVSALGFAPQDGVDAFLAQRARATGKPILELETLAQQIEPLISLPLPVQHAFLGQTFDNLEATSVHLHALLDAWLEADADALYELMVEDFADELEPLKETFLDSRSRRMAAHVAELAREPHTTLVVVGAGHLGGADGVLAQLRDRGFKLQRLNRAGEAVSPVEESVSEAARQKSANNESAR